jgi:hypothetical protein
MTQFTTVIDYRDGTTDVTVYATLREAILASNEECKWEDTLTAKVFEEETDGDKQMIYSRNGDFAHYHAIAN